MAETNFQHQVEEAAAFLKTRLARQPEIVLSLGTGLGTIAQQIEQAEIIPYEAIPHFPAATVQSHAGNLVTGTVAGKKVVALQGRMHFYEGYSAQQLTLPLRVMTLLGCTTLVIANAAGGLNPDFAAGNVMVIDDHLNFLGDNPLRGANVDEWGPRFPDMSRPYSRELADLFMECARELGKASCCRGVYVCIPGPSLETPAETRFLRMAGADAVGMSTVPEVIVANHAGLRVLGISLIANLNDPDRMQPILLDDVLAQVEKSQAKLAGILELLFSRL